MLTRTTELPMLESFETTGLIILIRNRWREFDEICHHYSWNRWITWEKKGEYKNAEKATAWKQSKC